MILREVVARNKRDNETPRIVRIQIGNPVADRGDERRNGSHVCVMVFIGALRGKERSREKRE